MDMPNVNGSCVRSSQKTNLPLFPKECDEKKNKLNGKGGKELNVQVQLNGNEGHACFSGRGVLRTRTADHAKHIKIQML